MHSAHIVQPSGDHARAVGQNEMAQLRCRQFAAMFRDQAGCVEASATVAAAARHVQHREAGSDQAGDDEAGACFRSVREIAMVRGSDRMVRHLPVRAVVD
jgi:hypothetical protein